ncbi:ERF family protein [Bradyrhizobium sp. HKCCYLS2038]|uniref:ERF family protein n=1 Tax=unclassified Bradyrhizobium TaxID=2631580 RepID=UPI003EBAF6A6
MSSVEIVTPEPPRRRRSLDGRAIQKQAHGAPVAAQSAGALDIVRAAMATGNVEMLREAVALAKELDAIAARKAFDRAMSEAKAHIPVIRKNRRVAFESRKGGANTDYAHEDMAEIARTVDPILGEHGLSYRFRVSSKIGEPVSVTCIVTHRDGHYEETTLDAGRDDSGNKNAIQGVGSTITYLQRYSLKAALGLAASADDDSRATEAADEPPAYAPLPGSITDEQAAYLREALEAKGASERAFIQFAASKGLFTNGRKHLIAEIPAEKYGFCVNAIAGFRKA